MNKPSSRRTPRRALRVYLAGDACPEWRLELIQAHQLEAYTKAVQQKESPPLVGALPYGHDLVGPFGGTGPGKQHLQQIARADFVFAWYQVGSSREELTLATTLGAAYGLGKAIILAGATKLHLENPFLPALAWKVFTAPSVRSVYEDATADMDITFDRGVRRVTANFFGKCSICQGSYDEGLTIYWSQATRGMHLDCYERAQQESDPSVLVFNSELIHTLREENAKLERECLELMTKNSLLEQELKLKSR